MKTELSPSIDLYVARPGRATSDESGTPGRATSEKRWAKIPWEVGTDDRLTECDIRVYFALAACRRASAVSVGTRWIGDAIHLGRNRVAKSLRRLVELKHVEIDRGKRGQRPTYHLTSQIYAPETGSATVVRPPKPGSTGEPSRSIPVVCQKCRRICKRLPAGVCRSCRTEAKVEKTARRVAREEIAAVKIA